MIIMEHRCFTGMTVVLLMLICRGGTVKTKQLYVGDGMKIRCRAEVTGTSHGIRWGVPEHVTSSGRLQISSTKLERVGEKLEYRASIRVVNMTAKDTGYYTCMYNQLRMNRTTTDGEYDRSYSHKQTWIKRMYVYVYDKNSLLLETPHAVEVELSGDLILPCRVTARSASINITELAAEEDLDSSRVSYDPSIGFVISNATDYDAGIWYCKAELGNGVKVKRRIRVDVVRSGEMETVIGDVVVVAEKPRVLLDNTIEVTCEVLVHRGGRVKFLWNAPESNTTTVVEYGYEDAADKSDMSEVSKDALIWWSKLTRINTGLDDSGDYACSVLSYKTTDHARASVKVYENPFINVLERPLSIETENGFEIYVVYGTEVDLSFKVDALPRPDMQWFNGSNPLEETMQSSDAEDSRVTVSGSRFLIREVDFSDMAAFTLKITTPYSVWSETIALIVMAPLPAEIVLPIKSKTVVSLGKHLNLYCDFTGVPIPAISWFHNGLRLQETSADLTVRRVKSIDEGNYTCIVNNSYGADASSTIVYVKDPSTTKRIAMWASSAFMVVAVVSTAWLLFFKVRKVKKLKRQLNLEQQYLVPIINLKDIPADERTQCMEYDPKKWEFPRDRLRFGKTLGRGAFGRVVQATAFDLEKSSSCRTIAVKMLKVGSRTSEYRALMSELKILIHLGPHLNIVNLLGACTTKEGPLMILVEYCRHGNLSVYLRGMRDYYVGSRSDNEPDGDDNEKKSRLLSDDSADDGAFSAIEEDTDRASWVTDKRVSRTSCGSTAESIGSQECDTNEKTQFSSGYEDSRLSLHKSRESNDDDHKEKKDKKKSLNLTDLLSYSLQVSRGMEFLASKKCIHRDLAARNILLSDYQVVKICDFGLARDVYKDPDYMRSGDARLPLKWMAPESIFDKVYTTKSDVWSFGVLLWEIFTLGGSPYPGMQIDEDFCNKLKRGVRMSKPQYANDAAYSAMLACWANSPEERPTFTKLCEELSDVLQAEAGHEYLDILKIFENSEETKLPLRGLKPQQSPEETFEEVKCKIDHDVCSTSVNYTDVEVGVLRKLGEAAPADMKEEIRVDVNQDSFDSMIEITEENIELDHLVLPTEGYQSEDSGMCASTDRNLLYVDTGSYRSLDTCSAASSCEAPPLYDDVIARRNLTDV